MCHQQAVQRRRAAERPAAAQAAFSGRGRFVAYKAGRRNIAAKALARGKQAKLTSVQRRRSLGARAVSAAGRTFPGLQPYSVSKTSMSSISAAAGGPGDTLLFARLTVDAAVAAASAQAYPINRTLQLSEPLGTGGIAQAV